MELVRHIQLSPGPGRVTQACGGSPIRYVVVIDGEHYPPVTNAAIRDLAAGGHEVLGAALAGGKEKLGRDGLADIAVEVETADDPAVALEQAIARWSPEAVYDFSDDPVLEYRKRHLLASVALHAEVSYVGADFRFTPPSRPEICTKPSIACIATGKRTGKTAITGFAARTLVADGRKPVIVSMGRGGPPDPEVLRGDEIELTAKDLLELADSGKHAASDYVEDALLGRVPAVGCRRCGGGLAGGVEFGNVHLGVECANELPGDLILLEGSGSAIPPARSDVTLLVVPASIDPEYLKGYFGPYRLLLADAVLVTMCEEPFGSPSRISEISSLVDNAYRGGKDDLRLVRSVFRPAPTQDVQGVNVFVATTAPREAAGTIRSHLEDEHGCRVVGITHALSDRDVLTSEIADMADRADALLCEVKAAAVDVATRQAVECGLDVVYMDNVPHGVEGDDPADIVRWAAELATERFGRTA